MPLKPFSSAYAVLGIACLSAALPIQAAMTPVVLRCEYRKDPAGIEVIRPQFSWQLDSGDDSVRGVRQTAYQIVVSSTSTLLTKDQGDLWDSGKIVSDESTHIAYAGKPLVSGQHCFWKVRVWTANLAKEACEGWSTPSYWTMGLLKPEDWQATWIGAREITPAGTGGLLGWAVETKTADDAQWAQIDLGEVRKIDQVIVHPMLHNDPGAGGLIKGYGFPTRFRIEISDDVEFKAGTLIADQTASDYPNPGLKKLPFSAGGRSGRYVRLTATKLWHRGGVLPHVVTLAEIEVMSGGINVALTRPVSVSGTYEGSGWGKAHLTDGQLLCTKEAGSVPKELEDYPHAAILLRREMEISKPVQRATVYLSGLGWSELSINGKKVGDSVLSPEFTDYNKRVPYIVHDVTACLKQGANALGVILGNGFSATPNLGYLKWYGNGGQPRLLFQMEIEYVDGSRQTVVSDELWKWSTGEITFNDLWVGEHIDHRLAQPGWDQPGFKDAAWHPALRVAPPKGKLFARTVPPLLQMASENPVKIDGNTFTFNTVGAGWLRLKTSGQAGDKVTVNYINTAAGHVHYGRTLTTECLLKGGGDEVFEPKFLFHTIDKTVTVDGLKTPATPETLTQQSVCIDLPRTGSFECSNDFLNRQYQALLRTQRNYNFDYPMDPTREKSGWTQDVMTMLNSTVYDFDAAAFYWNWWQSMRDNQRPDGYLGSVIPLVNRVLDDCNCVWWNGMIVYTPWKLYEYYGDRRFLEQSYPAMVSYMNWLATKADKDQIVAWGLGDWIEVGSSSSPKRTSVAITSTCGYYYYATLLSQTATILGKHEDAARYAKLATAITDGFNRRFLNTQTGQVGSNPDTQTAQILPLYFGMVPVEQRQRVLERLVANIHERKEHISTGFIGTLHLLLGLPELGQAELTHTLVMQQDYPGWNTLVQNGVQMETWNGGQVQMPSLGGPIGAYLYQVLAGIQPDASAPGFKKIIIKPAIVGDLTWVNAHYESIHGRIVSHWKREAAHVKLDVTIPPNTRATIYVPAKDAASVTEGDTLACHANGVHFLRLEAGRALFEVGSGHYVFTSALPASKGQGNTN
jgi:alpha-L-rhamnosidase